MNAIVCVDEKNGIGKDGKLLCSIPDDMKHFVEKTKGSIVVMGRKTLYSFKDKEPLKNRINIVLTKNKKKLEDEYRNKGYGNIFFVDDEKDIELLISKYEYSEAEGYTVKTNRDISKKEVYVIGGESIYKMFIDKCDTLYITKLYKIFDADTYFPDYESMGYKEVEKSDVESFEDVDYQFITYRK